MSKNTRSMSNDDDKSMSRKKTSLHTAESNLSLGLKPTTSFQDLLNTRQLIKVRTTKWESVGGEIKTFGDESFLDLGNLNYDESNGRLLDPDDGAEGKRIMQVVRARQEFIKHTKEEVGHIGYHDPVTKKALKKMKLPNIPKKDKARRFLEKCILRSISFSMLTDKQVQLMINALKPKKVAEGVNLIVQGDIGKSFYIVQKGSLTATEKTKDNKECLIQTFNKGDCFGELALLYGTRRPVTVKTNSLCLLWKLDNLSFKKIMAHNDNEEVDFDLLFAQLQLMPLVVESEIADNEEQLKFLAQNVHPVVVKKGQVLIRKGDQGGDMMYLIKQGRVRCTKAENDSESIEFITGDYFGEGSLVHKFMLEKRADLEETPKLRRLFMKKYRKKWNRAANVITTRDTEFFVIAYDAFKRLAESDNKFIEVMSHNYGLRILKSSKMINSLRKTYRDYLLDNLEIVEFKDNDIIIQKGDVEKVLFLVVEGKIELRKEQATSKIKLRQSKRRKYMISVGGDYGAKTFFSKKPYKHDVVAIGSVKLYAMTHTIFTELFGTELTTKDILKTGNPEVDEQTTIDFENFQFGALNDLQSFTAISKAMKPNDPRSSSRMLQKISTNFVIDKRTSVVKRRKQSVRVKKRDAEEKLGLTIESSLKIMKKEHQIKMKSFRKISKQVQLETRAEPFEVFKKKFKVVGPIGKGTFGMVKMVKSRKQPQRFALKILDIKKIVKLGQQEAVINERDILAELKHPFVLKYVASYKSMKKLSILTELLIGGELYEVIQSFRKKETYMPDEHAKFYTACMVETFSFLHRKEVLYRDLKPENVMIDALGYTRLVDFGFAKKCKFKTFTRCGTAEYFAPELLLQRGYNKSVDLWGIGVLTYEMMTGMSPFYNSDDTEMLDQILHEDPDFSEFPELAMDFIDRLLEKEPNQRLGMSLKNPREMKQHPFLKGISWKQLRMKQLEAPFVPNKKKMKIRTETELNMRLNGEESITGFEVELKEREYKGWYAHF